VIRALVTGGSGDIGRTICEALAAAGMAVWVHAHRHPERAAAVVERIRAQGGQAHTLCFDVLDAAAVGAALQPLVDTQPIQVVVNNAGIHQDMPMAGMPEPVWRNVVEVSLHGFFNVTQPLLLPMLATRWGRIVNVTSVAGQMGNRGQTNYAAAKAGLVGATRSLAREVASRGVTVNAVSPGVIESAATREVFDAQAIRNTVPMNRAGKPEEVAQLVAFLCSDQAAYITGQEIGINGGMI
jgi:3-oxoacyl-[acyl-carrier protein] reductase